MVSYIIRERVQIIELLYKIGGRINELLKDFEIENIDFVHASVDEKS